MTDHGVLDSLQFPLDDLCISGDRFEHLQILLEHTHALAGVLAAAVWSGDVQDDHVVDSLKVMRGYCETNVALCERLGETWRAQRAQPAAQRPSRGDQPLPKDAAAALAELHTLLAQCPPEILPPLVGFARRFMSDAAPPQPDAASAAPADERTAPAPEGPKPRRTRSREAQPALYQRPDAVSPDAPPSRDDSPLGTAADSLHETRPLLPPVWHR